MVSAAGDTRTGRLAEVVPPAALTPPPDHLLYLIRQIHEVLDIGRPDVAVTNMCHALRVAKAEPLTEAEDTALRLLERTHGGVR